MSIKQGAKGSKGPENKTVIFRLAQKVQPRGVLVGANGQPTGDVDLPYPPYKKIKNPVLTFDEATGRTRWARLLNGFPTIWQDEQDVPHKLTPEQVAPLIVDVAFKDGVLWAKSDIDATMIEFLKVHDDFEQKEKRISGKLPVFNIVSGDSGVEAEDKLLELEIDAMEKAGDVKDINDIKAHATFLNVKMTDDFGQELSDKALRLAYKKAAKKNPKAFIASFNNPAPKASYLITESVKNGVIDLNKVKGQAHWGETGALITPLDPEKDPLANLVEFALGGSKEGEAFHKQLIQLSK